MHQDLNMLSAEVPLFLLFEPYESARNPKATAMPIQNLLPLNPF